MICSDFKLENRVTMEVALSLMISDLRVRLLDCSKSLDEIFKLMEMMNHEGACDNVFFTV